MAALSAAPIPDLSEESDELDEPDLSDEEPDWLDESLVPSLESLWELSLELSGELDASAFLAASASCCLASLRISVRIIPKLSGELDA